MEGRKEAAPLYSLQPGLAKGPSGPEPKRIKDSSLGDDGGVLTREFLWRDYRAHAAKVGITQEGAGGNMLLLLHTHTNCCTRIGYVYGGLRTHVTCGREGKRGEREKKKGKQRLSLKNEAPFFYSTTTVLRGGGGLRSAAVS